MKYTWTKENFESKKFDKILVLVIGNNQEARSIFENTIVKALAEENIHAENSLKLFPPIISIDKLSENAIESKIRVAGYDAVLVSSLVDVKSQEVFEYSGYYHPYNYRFPRHIYYGYGYVYRPGYYRQEKSYVVESRLFDATEASAEDAIIWSGQSELVDPRSFDSGAKEHAFSMVKTLLKSGVLQKP
ncbi:hypothetical protein OU798_16375 [Prolixibacteraceae bacterium Z1-6]|uniref:Uncharacterized protein n=1 Tax=Draconibacterium aestuarii TaxID=2998507 RepID=A0A9X3FB07_9BACT|nr:hypothetical protein [Prolixibacteraceae bacterium Z1-6]